MSRQNIAERFARETAEHEMRILHDDGLYRHVRFTPAPKEGQVRHSFYWFELITLPGALIFQGDGDSFTFRRDVDMFEFFRTSAYAGEPNLSYWAEKVTSGRDQVMKYDQERHHEQVLKHLAEYYENTQLPAGLHEAVQDKVLDEFVGDETYDRQFVQEFKFYANANDRWDYDKKPDFEFHDASEWNLKDYDWWFEWACQAIVWGIKQYNAHSDLARPITSATPARLRKATALKCAPLKAPAPAETPSGNPYASLDENAAIPPRYVDVHLPEPTEVPA